MLVGVVRSGLVEARHPVTVAAAAADGEIVFRSGDAQEARFFLRSAAKPFQAAVSARHAPLAPEQLAVAAGSHGGQPVHVALVEGMLAEAGLSPGHLRCPPTWPLDAGAGRRLAASGVAAPQALFNNCSGKHAAMLRACAARGWPLAYPDPEHPLQAEMRAAVADATGEPPGPVGVDGCGVPTFRSTAAGAARAFARLAADPALAPVAGAMARLAPLTADGERPEAELARWLPAAVKGGAQGCLGVAWVGGLGVAAKSWTGESAPAMVAVIAVLRRLGVLGAHGAGMLAELAGPVVTGGGRPVGRMEPIGESW